MRLFRQKERDNWEPVFAEIAAAALTVGSTRPTAAREPVTMSLAPYPKLPAGLDGPDALNDRGVALAREGRLDEAAECFHQSLRLKPNGAGNP